jgi:glycerate kinase
MPHTEVKQVYTVDLTAREYRLVVMGLAGILRDQQDIEEAKILNVHLCHQRVVGLKQQKEVAEKALENAQAEIEDNNEEQKT